VWKIVLGRLERLSLTPEAAPHSFTVARTAMLGNQVGYVRIPCRKRSITEVD